MVEPLVPGVPCSFHETTFDPSRQVGVASIVTFESVLVLLDRHAEYVALEVRGVVALATTIALATKAIDPAAIPAILSARTAPPSICMRSRLLLRTVSNRSLVMLATFFNFPAAEAGRVICVAGALPASQRP